MMRECLHCHQAFIPKDLEKDVSKGIEHERKASGVEGVFFRCYVCSLCGHENLFVDLHPLPGETPEAFRRRRDDLEASIRQAPHGDVEVALVERTEGHGAL